MGMFEVRVYWPVLSPWVTEKLQTPNRVGSAALAAALLAQEKQPKFPRNEIIKL